MFDNGKVEIKTRVSDENIYQSFTYDHQKAIEGYKAPDVYCQVNVNIPNTYLKSILDLFDSDDFRFSDKKVHRDDDKFILEETNSVIITFAYQKIPKNNSKIASNYIDKLMISDGDEISICKQESNGEIISYSKNKGE